MLLNYTPLFALVLIWVMFLGFLERFLEYLSVRVYWLRSLRIRRSIESSLSVGLLPLALLAYLSLFLDFGPWAGDDSIYFESHTHSFCDNAKYLYLYVHNRRLYDKYFWISFIDDDFEKLRKRGLPVVKASASLYLRAGTIVSSGTRAPFELGKWTRFVSLWHGLPLKSIFWLNKNDDGLYGSALKRALYILSDPNLVSRNYYLLSPPSIFKEVFRLAFNLDESKLLLGPYPRNYVFIGRLDGEEIDAYTPEDFPEDTRLILYLPTYREYRFSMDVDEVLPLAEIDELCSRYDALFLVKTHFFEELSSATRKYDRIVILDSSRDIYPLLRRVDILITDYSSVAFDFLYADRPILFYPYDFDEYVKYRAQYIDYNLLTPGPKARTPEELINELRSLLEGDDEHRRARRIVRKLVWGDVSELEEKHFRELADKILRIVEGS